MKLAVHSLQALLIDMSIDLRCRNIGMAQHLLDDAQVRSVAEQMRRETMPEQVRINILLQA